MIAANEWQDYELLDTSDGERLERWGKFILIRPDPQVIWKNKRLHPLWRKADATYRRSSTGGGGWQNSRLPAAWEIGYKALTFRIKPMGFKHTGLFPEQAANWDWMAQKIRAAVRDIRILNLFAYTGGATVACAQAGAQVVHVDAAKGMVQMAKENAALSGLENAKIRYIVDDCKKFLEREIRRGNFYDGIVMDPPSYGRGPGGEVWKLEDAIGDLLELTSQVLSPNPLFVAVNSYTTGLSASTIGYLLHVTLCEKRGGYVISDEVGLPVTQTGAVLPCGAVARWQQTN